MRYRETLYAEYLAASHKSPLHPWLSHIIQSSASNPHDLPHLLLHGPPGVGKYTCALRLLEKYSSSQLKYEKKLTVPAYKAGAPPLDLKMSDVHFEVDLAMLGCNARAQWAAIYDAIQDAVAIAPGQHAFIVCKRLESAPRELLGQLSPLLTYRADRPITFLLLTEHVSRLPNSLVERCRRITIPRPSRAAYQRTAGRTITGDLSRITNIKPLLSGTDQVDLYRHAAQAICKTIASLDNFDFYTIRLRLFEFIHVCLKEMRDSGTDSV